MQHTKQSATKIRNGVHRKVSTQYKIVNTPRKTTPWIKQIVDVAT